MRRLAPGIVPLMGLACAVSLGACGRSRPSATVLVDPSASVSAAAANPVAVSPLPDTPDASAATQISFLGGRGTSVREVRVAGSLSGPHSGVLRRYSTGTGESFLPNRPFAAGERVTVTARVASGRLRGHLVRTSFTIAHQAPVAQKQFPLDPGDPKAIQHYLSAPALTPSAVKITSPAGTRASAGDLFLAPYQGKGSAGPMIVDQSGNLVWFHPLPPGEAATDFGVQRYRGAPVLTWWQGRILELGFGQGEDVIYDTSYRQVGSIRAGNGYSADLHVLRLTPQGTAWIDVFDPVAMNLAAAGGVAAGVLSDSVVQEIDMRTGLVMWEWHALGHIPLGDSKNPAPGSSYPWDYAHVNSVDPGSHGDVLMSFRNTWSIDDVDIHSGGFRWLIGGVRSTFKLGSRTTFYWQHDAAFQPRGLISLFDNGSDPAEEKQSRGLLLAPNSATHSVTLAGQFVNPAQTLLASSQGSFLSLPGGNWLAGYGGLPNFTEFDSAGRVLLDGTLGPGVQSFRASLSPWSATATGSPAVVTAAGARSVAVSWNGATDVASWRLLAGGSPAALAPVATAAKSGFETTIALPPSSRYVAVQALDAAGLVIGVSGTLKA